ncbi:MAG: hypothetical protein WA741_27490 [Candidatus Sulfotelmatobacter sp.]
MKHLNLLTLFSTLALLWPLSALARDKNQHSVDFDDTSRVGSTQLKPGSYTIEWQGTGPTVQVHFLKDGKTVATAPATLQTNKQVTQDDVVVGKSSANTKALEEIDFSRQKEALVFAEGGM